MSRSNCERFEQEALVLLEESQSLDSHFEECTDCQEAMAMYRELTNALVDVGSSHEPHPQWQARVWAEIARRHESQPRLGWRVWLVPLGVAAALLMVLVLPGLLQQSTDPGTQIAGGVETAQAPGLRVAIEPVGSVYRSVGAAIGDRLRLEATTGDARHAELRVYRDADELVLRCSTEAPCQQADGKLTAEIDFPEPGTYQTVLLLASSPLPAPSGAGFEVDLDRLYEGEVEVLPGDQIRVE